MQNLIKHYQSLVNNTIPISQYMQWQIVELSADMILTKTQLAPNVNVHGTGYAGSIYSAAIASGWTLLKAWIDLNDYQTTLLAAEANIQYLSPVITDFFCQAKISKNSSDFQKLTERMSQKKSVSYPLMIEVVCNDKVCAILNVNFVFKC